MPQPFTIIPSQGSDPCDEWIRLGVQAHQEGKLDKAEESYRHAVRLDPRNVTATHNLAIALAQRGNLNEALLAAERAAMWDGDTPHVHASRALICLESDRIDEGLAAAEQAIEIGLRKPKVEFPDGAVYAYIAKALISATAGRPQDAIAAYHEILDREPLNPMAGPNCCFIQTLVDHNPADLLAQRRKFAEKNRPPNVRKGHTNDRNPDRMIKVGYVGGDFKTHSAAMIFSNVLLNHDPKEVEHYLYCTLPINAEQDHMSKRFGESTEGMKRFRDFTQINDDQACDKIREDGIDILVDLAAHTSGGRLGIFLRKPAPVQITAWGFAHGTGIDEIDYFLADPVAVPQEERQFYAEKVLDLPCIVSYLPPPYQLKGTSIAPQMGRDFFTFGSYARYEKLSDECLRTFAEVLRRVPDSKLEFKDHAFRRPYSIRRVLSFMENIDPARLLFSISTSHPDHMLAYQQCDLCLDPWPHGGGAVFLEQMWMGVPVLTLRGKQPSGRTAASVLTAMGRTEWIAETPQEFVDKAALLASGGAETKQIITARKILRAEFLKSPVIEGYAKAVEKVYRTVWKEWCVR